MRYRLLPITDIIAQFLLLKVLISFPNGYKFFENLLQCCSVFFFVLKRILSQLGLL